MGACPDWYAWAVAAKWLGMAAPALEAHPDALYWFHRALAGMDAETRAREQREGMGQSWQSR